MWNAGLAFSTHDEAVAKAALLEHISTLPDARYDAEFLYRFEDIGWKVQRPSEIGDDANRFFILPSDASEEEKLKRSVLLDEAIRLRAI